MSPEDLLTLQMRYSRAVFLAEQHRHEAELLHADLLAAARNVVEPQAVNHPVQQKAEDRPARRIARLRRAHSNRLNFSEIARGLGVTPQMVRRVFLGTSTSKRISAAIEAAAERKGKSFHDAERAA